MGRGGKVGFRRSAGRRVRATAKGSDESDEDYRVGEDEQLDESEDEYVSSFDGDESEESLGEFVEEEEDEEEFIEKKVKRVGRPKRGVLGRKTNGVAKLKKKKQISHGKKVVDDSDDSDEYGGRKRNGVKKPRKKRRVSYGEQDEDDDCDDSDEYDSGKRKEVTKPRKKKRVSYIEQDDENYDDSNDDDDEEFTPDEIDNDVDDEDLIMETKKNKKLGRPRKQEKAITKDWKRKRTKVLKNGRKNLEKDSNTLGKARFRNDMEFGGGKSRVGEKKMKITGRGGGRGRTIESDSDFESSGVSDYEYTISEEEREQIREANEFCRNLTTNLRSSTPVKKLQVKQESLHPEIKRPGRKGKEKEEEVKIETGKQVCGICLSEEGKRTVRGTLNCCSHYFCFACIMEWSKVESRCPLCKQRFVTISKPARSHTGFDLRTVVIQVPERDQVYQPSEEELRGYLDPYENVICTECQLGGDDAFMLLCDLCDSPAHTYCVGLGREVPEGNWYCEGCRPAALDSSNPQGLNPTSDHRTSNNLSGGSSPIAHVRETFDLNEAYVPDTPMTQGMGQPSPRLSVGDSQATSPASGSGVFTVLERRRIQHQIRQIFNIRRQQDSESNGTIPAVSGNSLFGSQVGRGRVAQHTATPERRIASHNSASQGRLQGYTTHGLHGSTAIPPRLPHLRGSVFQSQASTSADSSSGGFLQNEFVGINTRFNSGLGLQQVHPCSSRSNIRSPDASSSPHPCREVSPFNVEKDQLQSMVRSHLKSLSSGLDLGYSTFKDIARSSTHTILAACGLVHRANEVYPVQTPLICVHVERMAGSQICATKGYCSSCFDLFVSNVVTEIMNSRVTLISKD